MAAVAAAALGAAPAGAAHPAHVLFPSNCTNERYRPPRIMIACGDRSLEAIHLHWHAWTRSEARAKGVARVRKCKSSCAKRHRHQWPATVKLTKPRQCPHGVRQFSRLRLNYLKPAPGPQHSSFPFPCGNIVPQRPIR
jgi:hypothetical protein